MKRGEKKEARRELLRRRRKAEEVREGDMRRWIHGTGEYEKGVVEAEKRGKSRRRRR
jgi:hypothetical protein